MAPEVAHRAVAEIPPAVPFRTGPVDLVERPPGRRPEPEVPVEPGGDRGRALGSFLGGDDIVVTRGGLGRLAAPGATDPDVDLAHGPDRTRLDELHDATVVVARVDL